MEERGDVGGGVDCLHTHIVCLNPYEYIRKYKCSSCNEVMMCECDRFIGEKFLSNQLRGGTKLDTQKSIKVTLGFQKNICNECRHEQVISSPKAEIYGRTSKIHRYYWREIFFETCIRYYNETGNSGILHKSPEIFNKIEKEVVEYFKKNHNSNPKYSYKEISDKEIIDQYSLEVIKVKAIHVRNGGKKVKIKDCEKLRTVEKFAVNYFLKRNYNVVICESGPFHVLFGSLMWLVIQDPNDSLNRMVCFGKRPQSGESISSAKEIIWTSLPEDFGTKGYYERRKGAIEKHINDLYDIDWLFDFGLYTNDGLREYLWATDENDIMRAKQLINVFSSDDIKKILHVLSKNYWKNYCGWPDLFVFNNNDRFFVEVKSANDKLSLDQKNWVILNNKELGFGFKIFKLIKQKKSENKL